MESLVEVCLNVGIGFFISYFLWFPVAALHGIENSHSQALSITTIYTVASVARGYVVRRWFNAGLHKAAIKIANKLRGFI